MGLTLVNLNLVQKDMARSLKQIASDKTVARETAYFQANIGKVTSVKDFLADQRLYAYAMKANGLEDMTYAKGFMKKVLESDLSNDQSFANRLTDDRYRKFALAFNFSGATTAAQSQAQEDDVIGLYNQSVTTEDDQVADDTRYYKQMVGTVQNVDQFLTNSRLRDYALKNFGYNTDFYSFSNIKSILTSDVSDPNSYVNKISNATEKARGLALANAFSFNTDGTVKAGGAQTAAQVTAVTDNYALTVPTHKTPSAAAVNRAYYVQQINQVTDVTQITGNSRMFEIVRTALGLPPSFLKATFENIVTSDVNDPNSYANTQDKTGGYKAIAKMFNFAADGSVAAGNAQSATYQNQILNGYNSHYRDSDETTRQSLITSYKNNIASIKKADDLLNNATMLKITLSAFNIQPGEFLKSDLKKVLTSDLSDPKSFANRANDPRLVKLAQDFNFDAKGAIAPPKMAQSTTSIQETAKNYIVQKTRFLVAPELDTARKKATDESTYYQTEVGKLKTVDALIGNRRLIDFTLVARGIDPKTVTNDFVKQIFKSDINDPKSFVNTQSDQRFKEIVASFNFDAKGNLIQNNKPSILDRGHLQQTLDNYLTNELEVRQGDDNPGVRLALYFQRKAQSITSAYDILGDSALLEVFKTTFQMPDQFSSMKIEQQQATVLKKLNLNDLKDPEKVKKLIQRFTVFYDLKNDSADGANAASILAGSSGGISANTLFTLSQLRNGA
nr:DUF1217 domain-containing protein [uncultured Gellertiella sp.]